MKKEVEILKEKCLLLDFKTAIQAELIGHNKQINETKKKATLCKASIKDINKKLKRLEAMEKAVS